MAPRCTGKNYNIVTLVITTISRHIEKPDIVITVYVGIFRHIQGHSAILSLVQAY